MPRAFQFPARDTMLWLPITTNRYWLDRPPRDTLHERGYSCDGTGWDASAASNSKHGVSRPRCDRRPVRWGRPRLEPGLGINVAPLSVQITGNAGWGSWSFSNRVAGTLNRLQ